MEKRTLLAVALCGLTLIVWQYIFPPPKPPPSATQGAAQPAPGSSAPSSAPATPTTAAAGAPPAAAAATPTAAPERRTTIERPGLYRAVLTSRGAGLLRMELLNPKYRAATPRRLVLRPGASVPEVEVLPDGPTDLVASYRPALGIRFPESNFTLPDALDQQAWELVDDQSGDARTPQVTYRWQSADVELRKRLVFAPDGYQIAMTVEVKNLRQAPLSFHFEAGLEGFQDPKQKQSGFFSARVPQNEAQWDRSGKMQYAAIDDLLNQVAPDKMLGDLRWIGIGQQFFLLALGMDHGPAVGDKRGRAKADATGAITVAAAYAERQLPPGETATYQLTAYAGPKQPEFLTPAGVGGKVLGLDTSIKNETLPGLGWIATPLVGPLRWLLRTFHGFAGSWGIAIVLLTMLVKLVTLWPTLKSMRSMKAMADLKPEVDRLKEKCGEDKQRFNLEMMNLYKKHGINPLGGCLPLLVQMPIWVALYLTLASSVDLLREAFVTPLWIPDLTQPDRFLALPLLLGAVSFLQTKLSPPPPDPQQKMMVTMMPIMFTVFNVFMPSGLTLYFLTNTVLGIIQQVAINRSKLAPKPAG